MSKTLPAACLILALSALASTAVALDSVEAFYSGKNIDMLVGSEPGSGYDTYARLIARHLPKHVPGNPKVTVKQMMGAGGVIATNYLANIAPKDGTAMGIVSQAVALEEALGSQGVQYKSADFNWIGRATSVIEIMMTFGDARAKTIKDALSREVLIGGTGPGSPSEGYPKLLNAGAGTKFRIIAGYPASAEVLLAMEKGEVDAAFTSWGSLSAYHQDWLDQKKVHLLVQGTVARTTELPDVPAVGELGNSPEDRQMLQLYASTADIGRAFIAPPGLPAERVATLRAAFDATMKDPEFVAEVVRAKVEFHPGTGLEMQKLIEKTAATPPGIIARMKSLLQPAK